MNTDIGATLHVYRKTVEVAVTSAVSSPRLQRPQDEDMDVSNDSAFVVVAVAAVVFVVAVVLAELEYAAAPNSLFHGTTGSLFRAP